MQETQLRNKLLQSASRQTVAVFPALRPKYIQLLLTFLGCLIQSAPGAFEGADLFRTINASEDGIHPSSMDNPARLPNQPFWLSIGYGKPMGLDWAAYRAASIGGRWRSTLGAAGIWISGDELYSERIVSFALAHVIRHRLTAGFAIAHHSIDIQDFSLGRGQLLVDAALTASPSANVDVSVWYGGQTLRQEDSYNSPKRQLFQIVATKRIGNSISGSIAFEKIPPFSLRQRVGITITTQQNFRVYLGYRTVPQTPCLGIQIPVGRLAISFRLLTHSTFGLSTAFGLSYK